MFVRQLSLKMHLLFMISKEVLLIKCNCKCLHKYLNETAYALIVLRLIDFNDVLCWSNVSPKNTTSTLFLIIKRVIIEWRSIFEVYLVSKVLCKLSQLIQITKHAVVIGQHSITTNFHSKLLQLSAHHATKSKPKVKKSLHKVYT